MHGKLEYGWGRDNSANTRDRQGQDDPLLKSLIMFPPDPSSVQCKKPNPDVTCEPVDWSITVPEGKYEVKITIGDSERKIGYSIKVNGQYLFKEKILDMNQYETDSIPVEAPDGIIVVKSECDLKAFPAHCPLVWSRMSAIDIAQIMAKDKKDDDDDDLGTKNLGCGNSFSGGRCEGEDPIDCVYEGIDGAG